MVLARPRAQLGVRPRRCPQEAARSSGGCHLVQVPARARLRPWLPEPTRDGRTEFQHPAADRLVGDVETALGQQVLDIPVAQREAEIQSHRVLDDLGRELMSRVRDRQHRPRLRGSSTSGHRSRDNADAMDRLHRKGMISDPVGKAKSVVFTEEGRREAERLFRELFARR
jgi:Domain of unknown function (DUF6429)